MAVHVKELIDCKITDINAEGKVIIPVGWFVAMIQTNNLLLTKSLEEVGNSDKLSDRVLHDIILDTSTGLTSINDTLLFWIYSTKEKKWYGLEESEDYHMYRFHIAKNRVINLPSVSPYSIQLDGNIDACGGNTEFTFNRLYSNYFCGKFPIKIKTCAPINGESALSNVGMYVKPASPKEEIGTVEVQNEQKKSRHGGKVPSFEERYKAFLK